ncbi:hypothetical protein [Promicromonospora sukumoe]|uniref:hypothetical protein n=1 Tax=Promicromonospora sukumoe TaxID=88382 RepID=UPI000399FAAD|nr:hypothetical protein [Promicromonospora sukumoe]
MAEIRGKFVYDDALRPGEAAGGGLSQLLFDGSGKLADHAVFIPEASDYAYDEYVVGSNDDGLSPEEVGEAIGVVIGIAVVVVAGAVRAAPHVKRWWHSSVALRLQRFSRTKQMRVGEPLALTAAPADFHRAVEDAIDLSGERMSRAEADKRLAATLAAAAFIADQVKTLADARDDADLAELHRAMEKLMTQEVTDRLNQALETGALVLDERTSNGFMGVFGGGRTADGRYVPIRNERIRSVLRLA